MTSASISMFEIKLADEINIILPQRLGSITTNVPADVAQKQAKLRDKGLLAPDMEAVEVNVTILTNYLMQTSYVATIRGLVKAVQLADRLRRERRDRQRALLLTIVSEFLEDLYSHRLVAPDGTVIEDAGQEVVELFAEICQYVLTTAEDIPDEELVKFLASRQEKYVRLVLERIRRLTTTIESVGSSSAMNDKLEDLLNRMEAASLEWLIDTYTLHLGEATHRARLPEIDNRTQREISQAVLTQMESRVREFDEDTKQGKQSPSLSALTNWVAGFGRTQVIDLSQTNLLQAEQFMVALRLHISYRQQITILSSILDKINEFTTALDGFEAVVSSVGREALAHVARSRMEERAVRNSELAESGDSIDAALAILSRAGQRSVEAEAELQDLLGAQDRELAERMSRLREFFSQKSEASNKVVAALTKLGNTVRVMSPMVIKEAGQRDAQFTTELLARVRECIKEIHNLEGSEIPKSN